MILEEEHLRMTTKGGCGDVVLSSQQDEIPESLRILQDRLVVGAGYSDVDVKMADPVPNTKPDEFLPRLLC